MHLHLFDDTCAYLLLQLSVVKGMSILEMDDARVDGTLSAVRLVRACSDGTRPTAFDC